MPVHACMLAYCDSDRKFHLTPKDIAAQAGPQQEKTNDYPHKALRQEAEQIVANELNTSGHLHREQC